MIRCSGVGFVGVLEVGVNVRVFVFFRWCLVFYDKDCFVFNSVSMFFK